MKNKKAFAIGTGLFLAILLFLLVGLLVVGGFFVQRIAKRAIQEGIQAYESANCSTAIYKFEQVEKFYLILDTATLEIVGDKKEECNQFLPGVEALEAEEYKQAIAAFDKFIDIHPDSPHHQTAIYNAVNAYKEWAMKLRVDGDLEGAIGIYTSIIDKYPTLSNPESIFEDMVTTYQHWGDSLLEENEYASAIEVYEKILNSELLVSFHAQTEKNIGDIYLEWVDIVQQQGRFEDAFQVLDDLAMNYPFAIASQNVNSLRGEIFLEWGSSLLQEGNYERAIEKYNTAIEQYIQSPDTIQIVNSIVGEIYLEWGSALRQEEAFERAIEKYNTALERYIQSQDTIQDVNFVVGEVYLEWGDVLRQEKAYDEAMEKYNIVMEQYAQSPAAASASENIPMIYLEIGTQQYQDGLFFAAMETFKLIESLTQEESILTQASSEYQKALSGLAMDPGAEGQMVLSQTLTSACSRKAATFPLVNSIEETPGKILVCPETSNDFEMPDNFLAAYPAHLRYVVKADLKWSSINRCDYVGGFFIWRRQQYWNVEVTNASTGVVYARERFYGSLPENCPHQYTFTNYYATISGDEPSLEPVIYWLESLLK